MCILCKGYLSANMISVGLKFNFIGDSTVLNGTIHINTTLVWREFKHYTIGLSSSSKP